MAIRILAVASYSNFKLDVAKDYIHYQTNKTPEFLKKFPLGQIPAFEGHDGFRLHQTSAIVSYIASPELKGHGDPKKAALIEQFVSVAADFQPLFRHLGYPSAGYAKPDPEGLPVALEKFHRLASFLNSHLEDKTYFVGDSITLADISLTCQLLLPLRYVIEPSELSKYPHLHRWFLTMINQSKMKAFLKGYELCKKTVPFNEKLFNERFGPKTTDTKQTTPSSTTKQETEPPKKKDPFAELPKSNMSMDDWKRQYSNNDTRSIAIPWLWSNFDSNAYSFWFAEYKYDNELTKTFMAANFINGVFDSAQSLNKHLFGSFLLFGSENNLKIKGVWLCRGQDLIFNLDHDATVDTDIFSIRKLDHTNEADKTLIENYLAWDGDFGSLTVNQGKYSNRDAN